MNYNLVILDGYTLNPGDLSWSKFEDIVSVTYYDRTPSNKVAERIKNADIVLTNKVVIDKLAITYASNLKFIGVLATGYDIVDVEAANKQGIVVSNVPQYGTESVSQFAISLLLEVCNQVGYHSQEVKKGRWSESKDWCFWDRPIIELNGKTMGIIGYGRIGQKTAQIARALGMNIIFYDEFINVYDRKVATKVNTLKELLKEADVVVLHCPLTNETKKIINHKTLSIMKSSAILINNSRGKLICDKALSKALREKKILAAAIDVVWDEPISKNNPLLQCENCFITPHISWASFEARSRIMDYSFENVKAFLENQPINIVGKDTN